MEFTPSYTVFAADLGYFLSNAQKYKKAAYLLKDNQEVNIPVFNLLATLIFELFPKVLIGNRVCIKYKADRNITTEKIEEEIESELRNFSHDLSSLYNHFPELLEYLQIKSFKKNITQFTWEYIIELESGALLIKDLEAVRYGAFARNKDVMTWNVDNDRVFGLLEKLEMYVIEDKSKTNQTLKGQE